MFLSQLLKGVTAQTWQSSWECSIVEKGINIHLRLIKRFYGVWWFNKSENSIFKILVGARAYPTGGGIARQVVAWHVRWWHGTSSTLSAQLPCLSGVLAQHVKKLFSKLIKKTYYILQTKLFTTPLLKIWKKSQQE